MMNVWLILFIVSGAAMIVIIALKALQEWLGLLLFWPNQRQIIEKKLAHQSEKIQTGFGKLNARTANIFMLFLIQKVRGFFLRIQMKLDKQSLELRRRIMGRKNTDEAGKASHFLHDIRSFKDRFKR